MCRPTEAGKAVVLEMLRCGPGETIPEGEQAHLLERFGVSGRSARKADLCDTIHREGLQEAREQYGKARNAGMNHPVILLCTLDVYRALRPPEREYGVEFLQAMEDETGNRTVSLIVEEHGHIHEGLLIHSPGAARALGPVPDPDRPFRIVVMTTQGTKVFSEPVPE